MLDTPEVLNTYVYMVCMLTFTSLPLNSLTMSFGPFLSGPGRLAHFFTPTSDTHPFPGSEEEETFSSMKNARMTVVTCLKCSIHTENAQNVYIFMISTS